jgi:hypothetical protein
MREPHYTYALELAFSVILRRGLPILLWMFLKLMPQRMDFALCL